MQHVMPADLNKTATPLAQEVGHYAEIPVPPPLRGIFACQWMHVLPTDADGTPLLVVPDGSIDLQWIDGVVRVAGPDRQPHAEALRPGAQVLGLRFHPGAAAAWLGIDMDALTDCRVALDDLWGSRAACLAADSSTEFVHRVAARPVADLTPDAAMAEAFCLLQSGMAPADSPLRWLCERLQQPERTLRRRFVQHFGYGPQTLARLLRYQRFLQLARAEPSTPLAQLAAEAGYADQPHLARESRHLAGRPPSTLPRD
ncbi:AraC family transcriptional regulator [Variovorax boronicumulans]|nr:AraC family transcriptional regulator [Variovorax boronicumulans]